MGIVVSRCPTCNVSLVDGMCTRCSAVYSVSSAYEPKNRVQHIAGPVPAAVLAVAGVVWAALFIGSGRMLLVGVIGAGALLVAAFKVLNTPRDIDPNKTWFQ